MFDADNTLIYVGKAKDLKKRVSSYFNKTQDSAKTRMLVGQINAINTTITRTEAEALLLESNLIKQHKPKYNVLLRDDKSYPYLYLSSDEQYPRLSFYRGAKTGKGRYFGPYPSAKSARRTLNLTQKLFKIRQCEDTFFNNRSRPCLQYQIKRCTAPCVALVDDNDYQDDVKHAVMFLEGRNEDVIRELAGPMQKASDKMEYERAARYRDQIASLRKIQENQYITAPEGEIDIVACAMREGVACVQVFYIRGGLNLGNRVFFPKHTKGLTAEPVLNAFMSQYYLGHFKERQMPAEILLSHRIEDAEALRTLLSEKCGRKLQIKHNHRRERKKWIEMALNNAEILLKTRLSAKEKYASRMESLQAALKRSEPVERIECFDISHSRGEATVASCVVFSNEGAVKSDYRKFNIKGIKAGDDYAAMAQAFARRYARVIKEAGRLPDVILIDGGKGQLSSIEAAIEELQLDGITLLGVAKGAARKPGLERLILADPSGELTLPADSAALHFIQEVRDEAHRFAIMGHRRQRDQKRKTSILEDIQGIGSKRRQALIRFFGGLQGIERAGIDELVKVPGINTHLAKKIYATLHGT